MSNKKYDKRVYAGYYKRYDGKLFYVVTMAKDGVTGEDMVIYMPYSIRNNENYLTISKKQVAADTNQTVSCVLYQNQRLSDLRKHIGHCVQI